MKNPFRRTSAAKLYALMAALTVFLGTPLAAQAQSVCPAGQVVAPAQGFAIGAFLTDNNNNGSAVGTQTAPNAVGPILGDGDEDQGAESQDTFFLSIDLEFTAEGGPLLPENSSVIVSAGQFFNNNGLALVQTSPDGINYTDIGTVGFGNNSGSITTLSGSNIFQHIPITIPAGGARFVRFDHQSGGFRLDGGERNEICVVSSGPTTADAVNDSGNVADVSALIPSLLNVVDNDTLDGASFPAPDAPGSTTTLVIANSTPLPPEFTFNLLTGDVGVVFNAPNGTYNFDYFICETSNLVNCDSATVTVIIDAPPPVINANGMCPIGQAAVAEEGFAIAAFRSNNNQPVGTQTADEAAGPILDEGDMESGPQSESTFFESIDLELTPDGSPFVPENSRVLVSVARFFGNAGLALVQSSTDGTNFTDIGTIGFGNNSGSLATLNDSNIDQNTIAHIPITIPAGGARYVRLDHQNGGFRVDGALRSEICQMQNLGPQISGFKTVEGAVDGQFSIPGQDVIYTITIENLGGTAVDADTIFLSDSLPAEVAFLNLPFEDSAGNTSPNPVFFEQFNDAGLSFNFAADIGFSTSTTPPTNISQCTSNITTGVNPDITFICFNPKGAMAAGNPNPSFEFKFRTRIE